MIVRNKPWLAVFRWVLLSACLLGSPLVFANGATTAWGEISEVYVHGAWTMVKVTGISSNPEPCASTDYYAVGTSDDNYSALHSTLLSAHIAGASVRFYVHGCAGQSGNYPHILSVMVSQ